MLKVAPEELAVRLPNTIFTARYDEPIQPRKNLIWCGTFQMAWDSVGRDVLQGALKLEGSPEMEQSLNRHLVGAAEVDPASCVAMAGFGRDQILGKIKAALNEKFGATASPSLLPGHVRDIDILAYAYLYKNLEFATPFKELEDRVFGGTAVKTFGVTAEGDERINQERRKQVKVLHYASDDEFVVELLTRSQGDRLLLARVPPVRTLQDTVAEAMRRMGPPSPIGDIEPLIVPKADFDVTRSFPEIEGRRLLNRGFEGTAIASAMQNVRFRLNEKGAMLKSKAAMELVGCAPLRVRIFDLCAPHLLLILRRGAKSPMFAMWRSDAELAVT